MACTKDDFTRDLQSEIPHLRRYARSLTRNPEAGDDLMQTSLEKALRHHASFHCGTQLRRWLFTIARNAYRDERKWLARRGDHLPIEDWLQETQAAPAQEKHLELEDVAGASPDFGRKTGMLSNCGCFRACPPGKLPSRRVWPLER